MKILQYTVKILDPTGSGLFSRIRTIKTFLSDPDLFDGSGQNGTDPDPTPSLLCCKCLIYSIPFRVEKNMLHLLTNSFKRSLISVLGHQGQKENLTDRTGEEEGKYSKRIV